MDAIERAYGQYMQDKRVDTDDDFEAFSDALFQHIIDPFEYLYDSLFDRLIEAARETSDAMADARIALDTELGL